MGLLKFSISSWSSFGKLYFSKNLSISSTLKNSILVMACLYQFYKVQIIFNYINDRNFYAASQQSVFNKHDSRLHSFLMR